MKWRRDGGGGAGGEATGAGTATIDPRRIRLQLERGENFPDEKPIAEVPADQVGVLADEPKTGTLPEVAFQHGTGVHIPQRSRAGSAQFVHALREQLQPLANHIVIIPVTGVTGDDARGRDAGCEMRDAGCGKVRLSTFDTLARRSGAETARPSTFLPITDGQCDDAARSGQHELRFDALVCIPFEVAHFAMLLSGQPELEFRGVIRRFGRSDTALVKPEFERAFPDGGFHAIKRGLRPLAAFPIACAGFIGWLREPSGTGGSPAGPPRGRSAFRCSPARRPGDNRARGA